MPRLTELLRGGKGQRNQRVAIIPGVPADDTQQNRRG
jgi:hypothetical protein